VSDGPELAANTVLQEERPLTPEHGIILRFFANNPLVGAIGSVASILSLVLAPFLYVEGRSTRELRFAVNPARTVVVKPGQTSRLSIILDGSPVKGSISAAQIAFWNEGSASIKPDHMLEPLIIQMPKNVGIIDASIRKTSRKVVKIELDESRLSSGILTVKKWNILERGDGASIQITYLGDVAARIKGTATIEGQGDIPDSDTANRSRYLLESCLWLVTTAIAVLLTRVILRRYKIRIGHNLTLFIAYALLVLLWFVFTSRGLSAGPPFGF
jgi:hypothetical protein